ncbi:MAG: sugar phosphate nucleotidyltransferase, partial [Thermomicrobiales bacterium]
MKVVILAGGFGARLSEETDHRPKPMVQIGGREMLWHIMKGYAHYGLNEFVIALGYKGDVIKRYFLDYHALNSSLTVDLATGNTTVMDGEHLDWRVHLV